MSIMYSTLVYPILNEGGSYTRPDLPSTFVSFGFTTYSWDLTSSNELDRVEYWIDNAGTLTLDQAIALSLSNVSAAYNKTKAIELLAATDWSELPSVTNPTNTPYLSNGTDFIAYRTQLRAIAITPTAGNIVFPVLPIESWV